MTFDLLFKAMNWRKLTSLKAVFKGFLGCFEGLYKGSFHRRFKGIGGNLLSLKLTDQLVTNSLDILCTP